MTLQSTKTQYRFDFLEKINYTTGLHLIMSNMDTKLLEAKIKNPKVDYSAQEETVDKMIKVYVWLCALFEEKELIYRHNLNLERLNLELKAEVNELKKQIEVLNKADKF